MITTRLQEVEQRMTRSEELLKKIERQLSGCKDRIHSTAHVDQRNRPRERLALLMPQPKPKAVRLDSLSPGTKIKWGDSVYVLVPGYAVRDIHTGLTMTVLGDTLVVPAEDKR